MTPLCRPAIARWFDPDADPAHHRMAATLCERCPLRSGCLADGKEQKASGIYGGTHLTEGRRHRNTNVNGSAA